jgi:cell division septation protein DedD
MMKNQWDIWIIVLTALVVILLIMNLSGNHRPAALTAPVQDEERQYIFMGDDGQPQVSATALPQSAGSSVVTPVVSAATPVIKTEPVVSNVSTVSPAADIGPVAYTIQVASFKDLVNAQAEEKKALASGFDAYVKAVDLGEKGQFHRVYVGKCHNRAEADAVLLKVKQKYPGSFIIVPSK